MTAQQGADTTPDARASRASPRPGGRQRPAVRRVVHGVLFVALAAGVFGAKLRFRLQIWKPPNRTSKWPIPKLRLRPKQSPRNRHCCNPHLTTKTRLSQLPRNRR